MTSSNNHQRPYAPASNVADAPPRGHLDLRIRASDDEETDREGGLATVTSKPELKRPPMYKVVLLNDDYTPMEFVVAILQQVFGKGPSEATQIMLKIHNSGMGVAGVYVLEVAETKVAVAIRPE